MSTISVRMASESDLTKLAQLFDAYRQFYAQPADLERARDFIGERLARNDSWILVAQRQDALLGFCQLYPSFSSTTTSRIAILNDLFVDQHVRSKGVGQALMLAAEDLAKKLGLNALELATAIDNKTAQALYERLDWQRDKNFYYYSKSINA
ncbi:MAG: GNAT family N-acetyltransferase [Arenimonas sp.]|nr:GNAT family N-acetyltransferase [Arenimonas sp.]